MSNRTQQDAQSIHGRNPQNLIETTIKFRIWDSQYWKEHCFALNAETLIDKALELKYVGGTYANTRPTEFLCLTLKMLQLQPQREIIMEYLRAEEFKYLRALTMFYIRLTFPAMDVFEILEPLLNDYRKLRYRYMDGHNDIVCIDEFADQLLAEERVCDIQLPRLTQRRVLEENEGLPRRVSKLGKAIGMDRLAGSDEESDAEEPERARGAESDSDRYISRSPTPISEEEQDQDQGAHRTGNAAAAAKSRDSPASDSDRYVSRSPTPPEDEGRYVSRSPTPEQE